MCCFNGDKVQLKKQKAYRAFRLVKTEKGYELHGPHMGYVYKPGSKSFKTTQLPGPHNEVGFYAYADKQHVSASCGVVAQVKADYKAKEAKLKAQIEKLRAVDSKSKILAALKKAYPGVKIVVN